MKPLALVGFADSRAGVFDVDYPVWTLNDAEFYGIPRIERLFDLHKKESLIQEGRWEALREPRPYPVYLLEADPEIPDSHTYPLDRVLEGCFENLFVGEKRAEYLSSSFPYMLALAVLETDYNPIYVYGVEFGSDTEFRYQREGALLLIGWAMGKGRKVIFPEGVNLVPRTLYGYENYQYIDTDRLTELQKEMRARYAELAPQIQGTVDYESKVLRQALMYDGARQFIDKMIASDGTGAVSRQTLEIMSWDLSIANSKFLGTFNSAHNVYLLMPERKGNAELRLDNFRAFYQSAGALRVCNQLIQECDRRGGNYQMVDPLVKV